MRRTILQSLGLFWFNFNSLPLLLMGLAIIERQSQLDTAETRT